LSIIKVAHLTTVDLSLRYLLLNQLRSIQQAGYEVTGISAAGSNVAAIEAAGIRFIPVPMVRASNPTPGADLHVLWHLYSLMRRERFTIVHTHTPKPDLLGQLAARMAGVPIVMSTLHGFYFHEHMPSKQRRFYITMAKVGALCSNLILSQNPEDIETAQKEGICRPEKIKLLGNGIDLIRFNHHQIDQHELAQKRAELRVPPGAPVVGFVGRLVKEKGIIELMEAARLLRDQVADIRFLLVGMVDEKKADAITPTIAQEYGVADNCLFVGHQEDMPIYYALMDLFVLPSHREGFPRSAMEAAAMALPAVVTNIRGCRTVVVDGQTGLHIPLKNAEALANAILYLLARPHEARRMGENGHRLAQQSFDERLIFEKVKAEYARLLTVNGFAIPQPMLDTEKSKLLPL
jgi:glycosyltransferase involved in cell wall biosynthesis